MQLTTEPKNMEIHLSPFKPTNISELTDKVRLKSLKFKVSEGVSICNVILSSDKKDISQTERPFRKDLFKPTFVLDCESRVPVDLSEYDWCILKVDSSKTEIGNGINPAEQTVILTCE
jgi:hypothetical protein